jgi:hypothetical protein
VTPEAGTARCSFCGKTIDDLRFLIAAEKASICEECVVHCHDMIFDRYLPVGHAVALVWRAAWGRARALGQAEPERASRRRLIRTFSPAPGGAIREA